MSFPFPTATIPELPNNATPPTTSLLEISNAGVSENTSISQMLNTAGVEFQTNKGAVSGYAGLDASQELLIDNFPSGTALQILRRNAGNTALEFADPTAASPLTTKGDLYTFDTDNQRLPVGTDGFVLTANSATSTGLEWVAIVSASQTPWTSDIDGAGFALLDTNYIEADDGAVTSFPTTGAIRLKDGNVVNWRDAVSGTAGIRMDNNVISFPGVTSYTIGGTINAQSQVANFDFVQVFSGIDFGSGSITSVTDIEMESGGFIFLDGGSSKWISGTASNVDINAATGGSIDLKINNVSEYTFDATNASFGNKQLKALSDPTDGSDAATKTYVDNLVNGLSWKNPAVVATTGNITLSGNQTIDGVLTVDDDRVLVKDQTSGQFNGVYAANSGAWTRTTDTDSEDDLLNMSIYISKGSSQADTSWVLTTDAPIIVDTTVLNYAQVGAGTGNPLTTKGDIFGYDTANARIPVGSDGQVLTANSAVSLGVEYATPFSSPLTTKGDIMAFSTIDDRLPVGTNGQVLVANSAVSLGVEWQTIAAASQTPWTSDIDADGFDLVDLSNIEFRNTSGAPAGSVTAIYKSGSVLNLNADAGDAVSIRAGGTAMANFGNGAVPSLQMAASSIQQEIGTAAASTGFMSLIRDGNYYHITGTTTITNITATGWQSGSIIQLNFDGALTVTDAATGSGEIILADSSNYVTVAGDVLTLVLDGTQWIEVSRSTISGGGASPLTTKGDIFTYDTGDARLPVGTNGQVLSANSAQPTGLEWIAAGGSQTPWTSDIDADGFDLTDLSNIEFRATTGAPAAGNQAIYNNADVAMTFNVPTADVFRWSIQGALGMQLNNLTLNLQNTTSLSQVNGITTQGIITLNTTGGGYISMNAIASPGNSGLATRGSIFMDSGNSNHLTIRRNDGIDVDLEAAGGGEVFTWTADHSAARFNLENTGAIDFHLSGPLVTPAATQPYIMYDTVPTPDGMKINVPGAREIALTFANVREYDFTTTVLDVHGNQIDNVSIFTSNAGTPATTGAIRLGASEEITWKGTGNNSIHFNGSNVFTIEITNGNDYTFSETLFDVNGNSIDNVKDITVDENIILGNAGTLPGGTVASHWWDGSAYMGFNVPNGDEYRFYSNAIEEYSFSQTTADFFNNSLINATITGATNTISGISEAMQTVAVGAAGTVLTSNGVGVAPTYQAGGGGDVVGPGSAVDNELVRFNAATGKIIQGTTIPVVMTDAGEPTWPRAILFANFNTGLPAATEVYIQRYFGSMRLGAPTGEGIDIYINAAAEYIFSSTNLNFNRNDADQLGAVIFNTAGAITGGLATDPYLEYISATHLQLNVPSGDEFNISVNDVEEYSFSSSIFEGNGNIIRNFTSLEIKSITGSGIVRIENTDSTPAAAQTVGTLQFRADRTASSPAEYATIQSVIVDPSAASADGELIFSVIQANNLTEYITLNEGGSTGIHFKRPVQDFLMDLTTGTSSIGNLEGLLFNDDTTQLSANSYIQRSNAHLVINSPTGEDIELGINDLPEMTIALNQITINPATNLLAGGDIVISDRLQANKGPDVTGATTITVGDGNYFDITGSGTINHMTFTGWQNGSMVTLQFDAAGTVNHNTGTNPANTVSFFLAGSVNQTWTAGSTLTVVYDGVVWREVARSLA